MLNLLARFRARRLDRSERGTSLMEMVVVTALLSLVTVVAFQAVDTMQKNARSTTDRFAATGEAQTIADRLTKDLRAAVTTAPGGAPFAYADANEVVFYANLGTVYPSLGNKPGPTRLHVRLVQISGTNVWQLREDATGPDSGGSIGNYTFTGTEVNRIDGKYLDTSVPIFTYYTYDSTDPTKLVALPTSSLPLDFNDPTDVGALQSIVAIGMKIRVRVTPTSPVAQIETMVHIRNIDYNPDT
jgi:hypothetical protein